MNFLKKKLKPLTSGFSASANSHHNNNKHDKGDKDLEDDLYDEYVVEAPPHPSELLALGVDPNEIDVNNPDKLRELYRKAKAEGKDKGTNSILLARQRQREEIEEKKKTREEWKFFDSITARVEQAVKDSQKTLEQLKESSAVDKLTEPEYELRLSADEVFKSSAGVKQEKSANNWIDFGEEETTTGKDSSKKKETEDDEDKSGTSELDEFGCPKKKKDSVDDSAKVAQNFIAEELFEDFGIDLRSEDQKRAEKKQQQLFRKEQHQQITTVEVGQVTQPKTVDLKAVARPRPRPNSTRLEESSDPAKIKEKEEADPFDTSFVAAPVETLLNNSQDEKSQKIETTQRKQAIDPFDTSFVNL